MYDSIQEPCVAIVATFVKLNNLITKVFPPFFVSPSSNQSSITGLSLNNGTEISIPDDKDPVQISFTHPHDRVRNHLLTSPHCFLTQEVTFKNRSCVFWDYTNRVWSQDGCVINEHLSHSQRTVCDCRHLTNFGILMDWSFTAPPYDPVLNTLTNVCLCTSITAIIFTEFILISYR